MLTNDGKLQPRAKKILLLTKLISRNKFQIEPLNILAVLVPLRKHYKR